MIRYADPALCPACRVLLPPNPDACPHCRMPLRGEQVHELFTTLTRADELVESIRGQAGAAAPAPRVGQPAAEAPAAPPITRPGLRMPSVPVILLGLGALALLSASLIFLAFAWSWLGVGGRTAVLVGLTGIFGAAAWLLMRRGLAIASEAFWAVTLGLLTLDLAGADNAGWLGDRSSPGFLSVLAIALTVVGVAVTLLSSAAGQRRAWVPQLCATAAALVVPVGFLRATSDHTALGHLVWVLVALAIAVALERLRLAVVAGGFAFSAFVYWLPLAGEGLWRAADSTFTHAVVQFHAWPLLAAAAVIALPAWVRPAFVLRGHRVAGGFLGVAGLLVTSYVAMPLWAHDTQSFALASLGALVVWLGAAVLLPGVWKVAAQIVTALMAALAGLAAFAGVARTVDEWARVAPYRRYWTYALDQPDAPYEPALLVLLVTALTAAAVYGLIRAKVIIRRDHAAVAAAPVLLALACVLALYGLPVVVASVPVLAAAVVLGAWSQLAPAGSRALLAGGLATVALAGLLFVPAGPSAGLLMATGLLVAAGTGMLHFISRDLVVALVAGAVAPIALGVAILAAMLLLHQPDEWRAMPVLFVMGLVIIARPRIPVEAGAIAMALVATTQSLSDGLGTPTTWAVYLTVGGAALTASALIHEHRRLLAVPGGLLLAGATWVRLWDLGVRQPEAYTLPTALVLVSLGVWWMRRDDAVGSLRALASGLGLATVPSLLWVFAYASPWRALVLGLVCLALVVYGAQARWAAPLVIGAVVGALLVLFEIRPYASLLPPWVLIGLGGVLLVTLGITWEARLRQLRSGAAYLATLR